MNSVRASTSKVVCCHFSSDGKLLASGGHDKKVNLYASSGLKHFHFSELEMKKTARHDEIFYVM